MSRNNRMVLSLSIVGALSATALLGIAVADDRDRNGDRHREMSFTRMFPELPPFAPPTDEARDQAKKLGEVAPFVWTECSMP